MKNGTVPVPTHYFVLVTKDSAIPGDMSGDTADLNVTNVLAVILDHQPTVQNCLVGEASIRVSCKLSCT